MTRKSIKTQVAKGMQNLRLASIEAELSVTATELVKISRRLQSLRSLVTTMQRELSDK